MRVLVICANYPPGHTGGYPIRCRNIVDALAGKGHSVLVLSSRATGAKHVPFSEVGYPVIRNLRLNDLSGVIHRMTERRYSHALGMLMGFITELWFDWRDTSFVDRQIARFQPDIIYLGHVTNLQKAILPHLRDRLLIYDEGGSGLIHRWTNKGIWYKFTDEYATRGAVVSAIKSLIVAGVCRLSGDRLEPHWAWPNRMHVFFNDALGYKNAVANGVPLNGAKVIHSGVDTGIFMFRSRSSLSTPVKFIIPGRIEPRKGQMDGVRLIAELKKRGIDAGMMLVGAVGSDSYDRELNEEVAKLSLQDKVLLRRMVPHDQLAALYREADICFFSSHYRTGFSRVPLEAMASGCIVISYGNEGSDEVIHDGRNGFLVQPADFERIADVIRGLLTNPKQVQDIVATARRDIESKFSLEKYVDAVEEFITAAAGTA